MLIAHGLDEHTLGGALPLPRRYARLPPPMTTAPAAASTQCIGRRCVWTDARPRCAVAIGAANTSVAKASTSVERTTERRRGPPPEALRQGRGGCQASQERRGGKAVRCIRGPRPHVA